MIENKAEPRTLLIERGIAWLRERLPETWELEFPAAADALPVATLRADGGYMASILLEPVESLSPRQASYLLQGFAKALRSINTGTVLLVVAPWLSPRTRAILAEEGINFVDLTGNALVRMRSPAVYLETVGETRNPAPKVRGKARLRGPRASRLIRLLADVRPPYGVRELAKAADLAPGYTSQLLETLFNEALVERSRRGQVVDVAVTELLRRWATTYSVLDSNEREAFIAPGGVDGLLPALTKAFAAGARAALTGSFAARRLAPVAAPALLLAYCDQPALLAQEMGLIRSEEGANVILLRPFDEVVWRRNAEEDGLRFAAPSQVAVDCLTGTGRMPAEGEALLEWMGTNERQWRLDSLAEAF
jgi:hypothetical protein